MRGAHHGIGFGFGLVGRCGIEVLGDAKVCHFGHKLTIVLFDEDVRWFEIPVNDAVLVCVCHTADDADEEVCELLKVRPVLLDVVMQWQSINEIKDERGLTVHRQGIVNAHDVGVLPLGLESSLVDESLLQCGC